MPSGPSRPARVRPLGRGVDRGAAVVVARCLRRHTRGRRRRTGPHLPRPDAADGRAPHTRRVGRARPPLQPLSASAADGRRRRPSVIGTAGAVRWCPAPFAVLTFGGPRQVIIPAGGEVISDPLFVDVQPFEQLAVSFHRVGSAALDYHQWAQSTNYAAAPAPATTPRCERARSPRRVTSSYARERRSTCWRRATSAPWSPSATRSPTASARRRTPNRRWTDQLARRLRRLVDAALGRQRRHRRQPRRAVGSRHRAVAAERGSTATRSRSRA